MDPNENLRRLRELYKQIIERDEYEGVYHQACEMADLIEALDNWLTKGGFLPADWVWKDGV